MGILCALPFSCFREIYDCFSFSHRESNYVARLPKARQLNDNLHHTQPEEAEKTFTINFPEKISWQIHSPEWASTEKSSAPALELSR